MMERTLNFRMTVEQRRYVDQMSEIMGISPAEFMRDLIEQAMQDES